MRREERNSQRERERSSLALLYLSEIAFPSHNNEAIAFNFSHFLEFDRIDGRRRAAHLCVRGFESRSRGRAEAVVYNGRTGLIMSVRD